MAMSDRAKKSNLCYLLIHGGTKACRALFEKRVNDLRPNEEDPKTWTVDKFLQFNITKLESKLKREERVKLALVFPEPPRTTDINLWDVSLLCLILRETCRLGPELRMFLQQLRKERNKIVHNLNDADIDDSKYENRFEKLKLCIQRVLSETGDKTLERIVQDMITQLENGLIPNDELLKMDQTVRLSIEDIKQEVRHEHKETRKVIEKGDQKVTNTLDKLCRMVQELLRNQQEILGRLGSHSHVENPPPDATEKLIEAIRKCPNLYDHSRKEYMDTDIKDRVLQTIADSLNIPCLKEITVEVRTRNCSQEVERIASGGIVEIFNKEIMATSKEDTCRNTDNITELTACTEDMNELNHAVNDLCREFQEKDFTITEVEVGCIVLRIQCSSILSLLSLLRDYVSGSLDKSLTKIEEAARLLDGCENLRLEAVIYEDEFNRVLSTIKFEQFQSESIVMKASSPEETQILDTTTEDYNLPFGKQLTFYEYNDVSNCLNYCCTYNTKYIMTHDLNCSQRAR